MSNNNEHVISAIKAHVIWHTKFRQPFLIGDIEKRVRETIRRDCEDMGIRIFRGFVGADYVYLKIQYPPRWSPAKIVQKFKGHSSKTLRNEFPELRRDDLHGAIWDRSYFFYSFGDVTGEQLREYVESGGLQPLL